MKLKSGDIVVIALSFVLVILSIFACFLLKKNGKTVKIYENNKLIYSGNLYSDKTIELKNNTVDIKDGRAYMKHSNCKNQICVNTGKISNSRECVVCLPNKVIIEIE